MSGSHLDTQPTGGRYDGALGVLSALEVIRTLNEFNYVTEAPLEIVMWTNEEGCRFPPAMTGSAVFSGLHELNSALAIQDQKGTTLGSELERIKYNGSTPCSSRPIAGFIEIHIEQGPILEMENKNIGIVTGAQAQKWYEISITGMEAHAGPTPMSIRKDALVASAEIVLLVNSYALFSSSSILLPFWKEIINLKNEFKFRFLLDDAHGFGTLGKKGNGSGFEQVIQKDIDVYFATFAKSMASTGAFVSGDKEIIDFLGTSEEEI